MSSFWVGEEAVEEEEEEAVEASDIDSSLILVLRGSRTWCCGLAFATLMLPVDFEKGASSRGVEAPSREMDEGESKEKDWERMRTRGEGVRGGADSSAAIMAGGAEQALCSESYRSNEFDAVSDMKVTENETEGLSLLQTSAASEAYISLSPSCHVCSSLAR
jgi:hypothetical protein